ncbi:hypothetical protein [Comamonas aquatica]|uniref:hypothetical protein n=1 Tax=Comamonas aquatica TaxID=225991 RepID=UPI0024478737|nr:hypothetical protein [Comamonas aquatica]MDH0494074.1 site-specific DNA-methyltransferase [Comamonas aquatica]MDH1674519.1 site-specific DNA-methyltransferase [Comamonas aquatica]MDH1678908.1 site-specific DNA-methyltransferase [Comamonas aquatica]
MKLVSAKRSKKERIGINSWMPYYAGFSQDFVKSAIDYLGVKANDWIIDPWGGSGTTQVVSALASINSISIDVNPVMAVCTAAKNPNNIGIIMPSIESIDYIQCDSKDLLSKYFVEDSAAFLRGLFRNKLNGLKLNERKVIEPELAFNILVLFKSLNLFVRGNRTSNPTWVKVRRLDKIRINETEFAKIFKEQFILMQNDLSNFYPSSKIETLNFSLCSSNRNLELKDDFFDFLISSPPYLTRIDYANSTAIENSFLNDEKKFRLLREDTTGTTAIKGIDFIYSNDWGGKCLKFLEEVKNHKSRASATYYWKSYFQYFSDISASLDEIIKKMKFGATGILVVQNSYYKEIYIPLADIYVEMLNMKNVEASVIRREEVNGFYSRINKGANKYLVDKKYSEDFIFLRK